MFPDLKDINLQNLISSRRFLVVAIVAGILTLILFGVVIVPQSQVALKSRQEYLAAQKKLILLRKKAVALDAVRSLPIYQQQDQINKILPSRKAVFELLSALEQMGQRTGVSLSDLELAPGLLATQSAQAQKTARVNSENVRLGIEIITLRLNVTGNASQVNQFLQSVNQVTPLTSVTKMDLQSVASGSELNIGSSQLKNQIELSTYFFTKSISATVESDLPTVGSEEEIVLKSLGSFVQTPYVRPTSIIGGGNLDLFQAQGFEEPR